MKNKTTWNNIEFWSATFLRTWLFWLAGELASTRWMASVSSSSQTNLFIPYYPWLPNIPNCVSGKLVASIFFSNFDAKMTCVDIGIKYKMTK